MALKKATPDFENGDGQDDNAETQVLSPAERLKAAAAARAAEQEEQETKPAAKDPAPSSTKTDVATQGAKAGQIKPFKAMINPLEALKGAFFVEFDTLRSLKITNGNVVDNQTGKSLGDTVGIELLSYQDQWVISPGVDGDDGKEHVRYSDDGITTSKGDDCKEYLQRLIAGDFPEAKMSKRTVICGSLFDIGEKGRKTLPELQDCLVQMSLAPTTKSGFDRYMMDQAFNIGKGKIEATGADRIKIECVAQSKGGKDWTMGVFSRYEEPTAE